MNVVFKQIWISNRWEFMTEDGDIGFGVHYVERNGEKFDLVNRERVDSHSMMEEGELLCSRPVLCKSLTSFL